MNQAATNEVQSEIHVEHYDDELEIIDGPVVVPFVIDATHRILW